MHGVHALRFLNPRDHVNQRFDEPKAFAIEFCQNGRLAPKMMTLDFEDPIIEIEKQIDALESGSEAQRYAEEIAQLQACLLYTSPSPRDRQKSRMPSSA